MKRRNDSNKGEGAPYDRKYKDVLFKYILADKRALLKLYNALNGTKHRKTEDLEITTLEDVIHLGYKNDLSFVIGNTINLYEHQSTINPNIPLRALHYISMLYETYVNKYGNGDKVYSTTLVRLPCPQFVVFYNGIGFQEEERFLRLSDAYMETPADAAHLSLELVVRSININYGNNKELLGKCRELDGYAIFIHKIREYVGQGMAKKAALNCAIDYCIKNDILRDVFRKDREGIYMNMLFDYDQETHYRVLREEGKKEGIKEGREEGKRLAAEQLAALAAEIEALKRELAEARK